MPGKQIDFQMNLARLKVIDSLRDRIPSLVYRTGTSYMLFWMWYCLTQSMQQWNEQFTLGDRKHFSHSVYNPGWLWNKHTCTHIVIHDFSK